MNQAIHQSEIKMGCFDKASENELDALSARNRMFNEVQKGHTIAPIYRSPENPGKNSEISAMLNHFSLDLSGWNLPSFK